MAGARPARGGFVDGALALHDDPRLAGGTDWSRQDELRHGDRHATAAGAGFLHWHAHRPARVLFVDGEMSRRLLKQRIADEVARSGQAPGGFHALSHEDIEGFAPLNTPPGQACIERVVETIGGIDLIIFDSVMCLTIGDMKEEESWGQIMPWVRSLTKRNIGQIWIHHTGHDETRSYGTKTREWQLDVVQVLEAAKRDDADVSFQLEFRKARERTPTTRADFQPVRIALVNGRWRYELSEMKRKEHVSPTGLKFLEALHNVLAGSMEGRPTASEDEWQAECRRLGLLDPMAKPDSARALFSKYRRELVAGNRIACEGVLSWAL